ncbi:class I SAM-dependent methyltransferase [Actinoplanes siamensis]|uniref:NDP-hexose 3-C-methyltransferase n=1 Tax=Actinoplanes siamensis TaxID=1223317 RepID=A0A919NA13_9ACTN|nr:class I SAM-dependent methyltransferase [Actinoplanes siamensis]GIF07052.1 NDP-hexose 3-C-methyltransferase [Actinoplanes siamensis]
MTDDGNTRPRATCRVCGDGLEQFLDLGEQPISQAFVEPGADAEEFFFPLVVGVCTGCAMVQLLHDVPRDRMFHHDYPFYSSSSQAMQEYFAGVAREFLDTDLTGDRPFLVEIGCNDGVLLRTIKDAGVRHLGFEPSGGVADVARARGIRVRGDFFEERTAKEVCAAEGTADVIYSANTLCHIPYLDSVFRGVDALLAPDGVFVFEDPYLGDVVAQTSFDQIYDEHFYLWSAESVQATARRFGFELVDVRRLPVHGGEVRFTLARAGRRTPTPAVAALVAEERQRRLSSIDTLRGFAANVARVRDDLVRTLTDLRERGRRVVGYGATAKSATVLNLCGIGPDLVEFICDTTPDKHGKLTPGQHIPIRPAEAFADPYPDYALLFAWNHAAEIMAKERAFTASGGRWLRYVPDVHVV